MTTYLPAAPQCLLHYIRWNIRQTCGLEVHLSQGKWGTQPPVLASIIVQIGKTSSRQRKRAITSANIWKGFKQDDINWENLSPIHTPIPMIVFNLILVSVLAVRLFCEQALISLWFCDEIWCVMFSGLWFVLLNGRTKYLQEPKYKLL